MSHDTRLCVACLTRCLALIRGPCSPPGKADKRLDWIDTWKAMEQVYEANPNKVRAIGNYLPPCTARTKNASVDRHRSLERLCRILGPSIEGMQDRSGSQPSGASSVSGVYPFHAMSLYDPPTGPCPNQTFRPPARNTESPSLPIHPLARMGHPCLPIQSSSSWPKYMT